MATHKKVLAQCESCGCKMESAAVFPITIFQKKPLREDDTFHVTSFRARPGEKVKDFILETDAQLRMLLRKVFKKGIRENPHRYKKEDE